ncbi:helix-turn-helix domain-containing protein [Marinospirillum insulare]|uniref:HTH cro/C1-type domain-containing protein n=1 Tax=Marinospirillum insulare TaxID=217169 RepID=A0ABQ6A0V9_9GAMM|nr:helix-turn-helix domain-containing protein [Marinospirillum insulare]GLR63740.1 hypothetical protein GCM10007878_11750 [Marinospirillum insulare]
MQTRVYISLEAQYFLESAGQNIDLARKRRKLRIEDVCRRARITPQTYRRLRDGESGVGVGVLISVLQVLSLGDHYGDIADPVRDKVGLDLAKLVHNQKKRIKLGVLDEPSTDF